MNSSNTKPRTGSLHCSGKSVPTAQDWDTLQSCIKQLYIDKGMTCEELSQYMANKYDFHATKRMYKTKFQAWGFPTKKKKREDYLAMQAVAQHYQKAGEDVCFEVTKGNQKIIRTAEQINKELHRPGDKTPMELDKALEILNQNNITRISKPSTDSIRSRWVPDQAFPMDNPQDLLHQIQHEALFASASPSTKLGELCKDCSSSTQSPPIHPIPNIQCHNAMTPIIYDNDELLPMMHSSSLALDLGPTEWEAMYSQSMETDIQMSMGKSNDNSFFSEDLFPIHQNVEPINTSNDLSLSLPAQEKMQVVAWAATRLLECDGNEVFNLALCKRRGINVFKQMIGLEEVDNFLLPGLNWMTSVMGNSGDDEQLKEFLSECCNVIVQSGRQSPFYDMFFYTFAVYSGRQEDIASYGCNIVTNFNPSSSVLDWRNSNVIIGCLFSGWHLLRLKQYAAAIEGLQSLRGAMEDTVSSSDLLTANWSAILARAYAENDQLPLAIVTIRNAIEQFQSPGDYLTSFVMVLKDRLAGYLHECGEFDEAEQLFLDVFANRLRICGWNCKEVWHAIHELLNLLNGTFRFEDATNFRDECLQKFEDYAFSGSTEAQQHALESTLLARHPSAAHLLKPTINPVLCEFTWPN